MQETSLHLALKDWYTRDGDQQEVEIDGYEIDVVSDGQLIEIQTRHFDQIKPKLLALLEHHPLRLVHPIAQEKWIVRVSAEGDPISAARKSPKRGRPEHIFSELIRFPELIKHPNLTLEILMIQEEDTWRDDGQGSWRRKHWSIADRRLIKVIDRFTLANPDDFAVFLPTRLPYPFTSQDLAKAAQIPPRLAQQMLYCLRAMGVVERNHRRGRSYLYEIHSRRSI